MPTPCICSYYNCLNGLYIDWKAAINTNPTLAKQLRVKMEKASAIMALYYAAEAGSDTGNMTVMCARLRNLFAGNDCLDSGTPGGTTITESGTFENTDLDGTYTLTVVHNLNTLLISSLVIIDPDDVSVVVTPTVVDADTVTYCFGSAIGTGTFTWIVTAVPTI